MTRVAHRKRCPSNGGWGENHGHTGSTRASAYAPRGHRRVDRSPRTASVRALRALGADRAGGLHADCRPLLAASSCTPRHCVRSRQVEDREVGVRWDCADSDQGIVDKRPRLARIVGYSMPGFPFVRSGSIPRGLEGRLCCHVLRTRGRPMLPHPREDGKQKRDARWVQVARCGPGEGIQPAELSIQLGRGASTGSRAVAVGADHAQDASLY